MCQPWPVDEGCRKADGTNDETLNDETVNEETVNDETVIVESCPS